MSLTFETLLFAVPAVLGAVALHLAKKRVQRREACYGLYKVRDDLVCLVAENKLREDSHVFRTYYDRINTYLQNVPRVGLDHALEALLEVRESRDFADSVVSMRTEAAEMMALEEMRSDEVRLAVAHYYKAVSRLILAHSNLARFMYLNLVYNHLLPLVDTLMPKLSGEVKAARFADDKFASIMSWRPPPGGGNRELEAA